MNGAFFICKTLILQENLLNFGVILRIFEIFLNSSNIFCFRPFSYCTFKRRWYTIIRKICNC